MSRFEIPEVVPGRIAEPAAVNDAFPWKGSLVGRDDGGDLALVMSGGGVGGAPVSSPSSTQCTNDIALSGGLEHRCPAREFTEQLTGGRQN